MADLYVKKRIPVEAFHWDPASSKLIQDKWDALRKFANNLVWWEHTNESPDGGVHYRVYDRLHDTWVEFYEGDWIIKGSLGEFYPHNGELFLQNYELYVEEGIDAVRPHP